MKTKVYRAYAKAPSRKAVKAAADALLRGELVVFPTETVYGIGANALDEKACRKIYKVKGRERDNPLIVHVSDMNMADHIGFISRRHEKVLERIWPGPLTVIVKSKGILPDIVTAGLDSVALRNPAGRLIRRIIDEAGVPVAAPSANLSKKPSSTKGSHAINYFRGRVSVIIDGGRAEYGIESTILDLRNFRIMRPGAFTAEDIERAFGRKPRVGSLAKGTGSASVPISPGTKYRHYSPDTPLFIYNGNIGRLYEILEGYGRKVAFIGSDEGCVALNGTGVKKLALGTKAGQRRMASMLFDMLIRLDSLKVDFCVIEPFEEKGIGAAAMNRIRKAAENRSFRDARGLSRLLQRQ